MQLLKVTSRGLNDVQTAKAKAVLTTALEEASKDLRLSLQRCVTASYTHKQHSIFMIGGHVSTKSDYYVEITITVCRSL